MQLGVPAASAATTAEVPSIVTAAQTRSVAADVRSAQVATQVLGQSVAVAGLFDTHVSYDLSILISRSVWMSQAQFFSEVRRDFVRVFPIPGATPLTLGANMNMRSSSPPALVNVHVAALVSNGWTFTARPGHPDFPNSSISFRFVKVGTNMYLKVHADISVFSAGGVCMLAVVCHAVYMRIAKSTWSGFATNLTRFWVNSWQII